MYSYEKYKGNWVWQDSKFPKFKKLKHIMLYFYKKMSNIFGGPFEIEVTSGLDNTTFLIDATSVGDAFTIIDQQITITNDSGLLLDPATHTISDQLNFIVTNTNAAILGQYATIADLSSATTAIDGHLDIIDAEQVTQNTAITALETFVSAQPTIDSNQDTAITDLGLRLDTAEQDIIEVTNIANQTSVGLNNHLTDATAHTAEQVYFLSPGGGSATRGLFLSGEGTTDSVYNFFADTFTPTNAFKPDTTVNPIAFQNKIFVFSSDAGGSFVSTDGGLNFTALTTPWNINVLVTSCDVGEYTASGTFALLLGMSNGTIYYTLDGINFLLDPVTAYSNQILALKWSDYAEWNFVVHLDTTLYGFDWTGASNGWSYASMPIEPTNVGTDVLGPIISDATGTYFYDWNDLSWTASTLLGTQKCFFSHSGTNAGDYYTLAVTEAGVLYSSFLNNNVADSFVLVNSIVEAGTVSSLTQYEPNKYLVTFNPALNGGHQVVWFEWPFTFFHYQASILSTIRGLTGGCNAVYASILPSTIDVVINSGTIATNDVDEAIRNLSTANTQVRAAGYQTSSNVSSAISSAITPYRTSAAQDTIDSGKYSTSNPANYQTDTDVSTALTPYRTSAAQDTIDSGKYSTSNPDNYITTAALTGYATTGDLSGYYPVSNPEGYVKLVDANTAYKSISSFNSDIANYRTSAAQDIISAYGARSNIRVVDVTYGVATPTLANQAFQTIAAALSGAPAGTTIFLYPGNHVLSAGITPQAGISFLGADKKNTTISYNATTTSSMFVINAANISFQNLTINMSSSSAVNIKMFEITSNNNTFHIDNVFCAINQTSTGASNIYMIYDTGPDPMDHESLFHVFEWVSNIHTTATGTVRNVYKNPSSGTGGDLHIESSQLFTESGVCVETAGPNGPELSLTNCFLQGPNELAQTTGNITLGKGSVLFNAASSSLPFQFFGSAQTWTFGDPGTINSGTNYMYKGTATSFNVLVPYRVNKNTVILNMHVNCRLAPGAGETLAFTLMKNGVDTTLTCTVANTALIASDITHAVQFLAGDLLAVRMVSSGNGAQDVSCSVDLY